jgi:hypothetical protein
MTINRHRITIALNRANLYGPTADAKLGAVEPDLDMWEAGKSQPTDAQLRRLAAMANVPLEFFALADHERPELVVSFVCSRSRRSQSVVLISMLGDPYPPAQPGLFAEPAP